MRLHTFECVVCISTHAWAETCATPCYKSIGSEVHPTYDGCWCMSATVYTPHIMRQSTCAVRSLRESPAQRAWPPPPPLAAALLNHPEGQTQRARAKQEATRHRYRCLRCPCWQPPRPGHRPQP